MCCRFYELSSSRQKLIDENTQIYTANFQPGLYPQCWVYGLWVSNCRQLIWKSPNQGPLRMVSWQKDRGLVDFAFCLYLKRMNRVPFFTCCHIAPEVCKVWKNTCGRALCLLHSWRCWMTAVMPHGLAVLYGAENCSDLKTALKII